MNEKTKTASKSKTPRKAAMILARAGVAVALVTVCAQISFPLPGTMIPVTLQTLAVMLAAVALPPLGALAAIGAYILAGLCGIPVFSRFQSTAAIFGPTGGFILGFLPASALLSLISGAVEKRNQPASLLKNENPQRKKRRIFLKYFSLILALIAFTVTVYAAGLGFFMVLTARTFPEALLLCVVPFLPGDVIKCAAVVLAYGKIIKLRKKF